MKVLLPLPSMCLEQMIQLWVLQRKRDVGKEERDSWIAAKMAGGWSTW